MSNSRWLHLMIEHALTNSIRVNRIHASKADQSRIEQKSHLQPVENFIPELITVNLPL